MDRDLIEKAKEEGLVICPKCGERYLESVSFSLLRVCSNCNGLGKIDWVDCLIGREGRQKKKRDYLERDIVMRNIQYLMQLIQEEGMRVGLEVKIDIKTAIQQCPYSGIMWGGRNY